MPRGAQEYTETSGGVEKTPGVKLCRMLELRKQRLLEVSVYEERMIEYIYVPRDAQEHTVEVSRKDTGSRVCKMLEVSMYEEQTIEYILRAKGCPRARRDKWRCQKDTGSRVCKMLEVSVYEEQMIISYVPRDAQEHVETIDGSQAGQAVQDIESSRTTFFAGK